MHTTTIKDLHNKSRRQIARRHFTEVKSRLAQPKLSDQEVICRAVSSKQVLLIDVASQLLVFFQVQVLVQFVDTPQPLDSLQIQTLIDNKA